jgi:hypothetical protein
LPDLDNDPLACNPLYFYVYFLATGVLA